jgi:hypothetical protein
LLVSRFKGNIVSGDDFKMNMSVYGIYTAEDCKKKFNELLVLNRLAEETPNKETVAQIKNPLHRYYKQGEYKDDAMSAVEKAFFFPAIHESFAKGPNINSRETWESGLADVEFYLTYYLRQLEA